MFDYTLTQLLLIVPAVLLTLTIVLEYLSRVTNINIKPTVFFDACYDKAKWGFTKIGEYVARVSGFLVHLKLEELVMSVVDVVYRIFKLFTTPLYAINGYFKQSFLVNYPILVYVGSALITIIVSYSIMYYFDIDFDTVYTFASNVFEWIFNKNVISPFGAACFMSVTFVAASLLHIYAYSNSNRI